MTRLTKHGKKRMKQRGGLHGKAAERIAQKALNEGICMKQTKGRLRKWLDGKYLAYPDNTERIFLIYGDKLYIFSKERTLITVIPIPADLTKDMQKMIRKKDKKK